MVQTLQETLMPGELPTIPGVEVAARFRPAESRIETGGDWYAAVPLSGRRLGLGVGDVAGHGLQAVTQMASARFSLRTLALEGDPPELVLGRLARVIETFEAGLRLGRARPGPVAHGRRGRCGSWRTAEIHLSGRRRASTPGRVGIGAGDSLVLYTDGLIERRGEHLQRGINRLRRAVALAPAGADEMCDFIMGELLAEPATEDDAALICVTVAR